MAAEHDLAPVQLPDSGQPSAQFCQDLQQALHRASWAGVHATASVMPAELLQRLVQAVTAITSKEPTLVELQPSAQQQRVTVVGDTHGQYHDVCKLLELYGAPSTDRIYVFNGDFVDRGAWGVEVLALLMAYKWLLPHNVYLVRGNHESSIITQVYGFAAELKAKYGKAAKGLFTHLKRFFGSLPLAVLVEGSTLVLHGGLFRAPPAKTKAGGKRRRSTGVKLTVGTLDDLRKAAKGGQDPDPDRSLKNQIACDVLWSDPVNDPGIRANEARGCGTVFGPDVTAAFLSANGLHLIIRSHEGPDARDKRLEGDKMPPVDSGYAEDHVTDSGKLVTLFSAPDYPQFVAEGDERYHNKAAVLHLTAPDYATPLVESFEAVLPRPQVQSYYEVPTYTEDEEDEGEQAGTTEAGSSQQGEQQASEAADDTASTAAAAAAAATAAAPEGEAPAVSIAMAGGAAVPAAAPVCVDAAATAAAEAAAAGAAEAAAMPEQQQPTASVPEPQPGRVLQQAGISTAAEPGSAAAAAAPMAAAGQQASQQLAASERIGQAVQPLPPASGGSPSQAKAEGMQDSNGSADTAAAAPAQQQAHEQLQQAPEAAAAARGSSLTAYAVAAPPWQPGVEEAAAAEPTPERPVKRQKMHALTPVAANGGG